LQGLNIADVEDADSVGEWLLVRGIVVEVLLHFGSVATFDSDDCQLTMSVPVVSVKTRSICSARFRMRTLANSTNTGKDSFESR